jgi:hypothetical protein
MLWGIYITTTISTPKSQPGIWINSGFALFESAGGIFTNSVAIMADALHDFGYSLSLGLSTYYFQKKSNQQRDNDFSQLPMVFRDRCVFELSLVLIHHIHGQAETHQPQVQPKTAWLRLCLSGIRILMFQKRCIPPNNK